MLKVKPPWSVGLTIMGQQVELKQQAEVAQLIALEAKPQSWVRGLQVPIREPMANTKAVELAKQHQGLAAKSWLR